MATGAALVAWVMLLACAGRPLGSYVEQLRMHVAAGVPTVWVAEGLMYYLAPDANAGLLRTLASVSAPGGMPRPHACTLLLVLK
jgi:hypothetical protein